MSWSVRIKAPPGLPDVEERISSFCHCPGNMYMCVSELKKKQLREMDATEAIGALKEVIYEIDKGNAGMFDDKYAVEADEKWSKGEETKESWELMRKFSVISYSEHCGRELRERCRETAVRFLLYYIAGYSIEYEW